MIVYAVEIEMSAALHDEYLMWLRGHVREMLELPSFTGAEILERREPPPDDGRRVVMVHYRLTDLPALRDYLRDHAPRMREAGLRRFGDRVRATRGVLESVS